MTDRELLEYAAKAVGIKLNIGQGSQEEGSWIWPINVDTGEDWIPLTDDGDALRLAVKLHMGIEVWEEGYSIATDGQGENMEEWHEGDPCAATRRAIVRVAASIGKAMQ